MKRLIRLLSIVLSLLIIVGTGIRTKAQENITYNGGSEVIVGKDTIASNFEMLEDGTIIISDTEGIISDGCSEVVDGKDILAENLEMLEDGTIIITEEDTSAHEIASCGSYVLRSYPEKVKTKKFIHTILDRNGVLMAKATVTVKGIYSEVYHYAEITDLSVSFNTLSNQFSSGTSISANKGYATIYFSNMIMATFEYTIYPNGNIQNTK